MERKTDKRRTRRIATTIVAILLSLLAVVYAGVSLVTADRLTRPTNHPLRIDPRLLSSDAQLWSTRTADGITLRGWYLPTEAGRLLIVLVPGMWGSRLEMGTVSRD